MRIGYCANCHDRIFRPIGSKAWVHAQPRRWRCQLQQAVGYNPMAELTRTIPKQDFATFKFYQGEEV